MFSSSLKKTLVSSSRFSFQNQLKTIGSYSRAPHYNKQNIGGGSLRISSNSKISQVNNHVNKLHNIRSFSTAADVTVNVTFVNYDGIRITVPGRIGMNVLEVAQLHDIELETGCNGGGSPIHQKQSEEFLEDKYGRGPACHYCHVKIPSPWIDEIENTQPKSGKERDLLEYNWEEEASETNSRLGCQVVLTKALDGLTVFIPDGPPSDMV